MDWSSSERGKRTDTIHDAYVAFMRRVQTMIVVISKVEKEELANRIKVKKATIGYDPKRWLKTQARIRDERNYDIEYKHLDLPAVVTGRHKFAFC